MVTLTDTPHYEVVTRGCGLVDRSERGKLLLGGEEAKDFLHGQVTNDVVGLAPGRGLYAAFLTHKGKMRGDLRVLDLGAEGLWLDTERVALQELFNLIRRYKVGRAVELHKRTLESALLSLVGPEARGTARAEPAGLGGEEHDHVASELAGVPVRLVTTDLGVDVLCATGHASAVTEALAAAGAVPVPEAAAEIVRVEHGRPRYGVDLDESVIPQEAALNDRAVSFTKGCYVGQETVARLFYKGKPNRHLRGLRLTAPAEPGSAVRLGEREVGRLASVAISPALGPIALALLRREAAPGDAVTVGEAGVDATVAELPLR